MVFVSILVGAALDARAQDLRAQDARAPDGSPVCGADPMPAGRAVRVIDGRSFVLDDGREIRLAALEVPPAGTDSPDGQAARAALAAMLEGESVELRRAAAASDRYGRIFAYAITAAGRRPVAHAMLARGHARLAPHAGGPACTAELLSQERVARNGKFGLWGNPQYGILDAGNLAGLVAGRGRFAIVEGKVVSVRESGGTIYVNFGRRWSQALTVTISKRQEGIFSNAGRSRQALEARRLRVRGWVEVRNGPRIEASRPEQIEFVEVN